MPLDVERLMSREFPDREFTYDAHQSSLYALTVGMAEDPCDRHDLAFVLGDSPRVLPSQTTAIAFDYRFIEDSGIDEVMILHGAQSVRMHNPLPAAATVVSSFRIRDVFDKGPGRGAVIVAEVRLRERDSGRPICTNVWTSYARGEGGFGGERGPSLKPPTMPGEPADHVVTTATSRIQPLLYRLLGDVNPLHVDPDVARAAGFDRPIMHGLCTFGIVCRAIVVALCDHDPDRVSALDLQFAAPAFPGEAVVVELWDHGREALIRARSGDSGADLALGRAELATGVSPETPDPSSVRRIFEVSSLGAVS